MRVFSIFTAADRPGNDDPAIAVVRDGFSLFAFAGALIWCLWHRLWLAFAVTVAIDAALIGFAVAVNFPTALAIGVAGAFLLSLESSSILEFELRRRGYVRRADILARNAAEAQLRWRLRAGGEALV